MDRRDFLKTTSTVIAGATLAPGSLAAGSPPRASANAVGRMILLCSAKNPYTANL